MEIEKKIQVSVVMGSQSDWLTMQGACDILQKFNVSFEKKIVSAHRTPDRLYEYANSLKKRKIKVVIDDHKDNVKISISDNGYGISKNDMKKIFEPSFTTKTSGMGLGLSMIKSILNAYKGNITFTTKSNVGTTFNIKFPKK